LQKRAYLHDVLKVFTGHIGTAPVLSLYVGCSMGSCSELASSSTPCGRNLQQK
jgi:hypothetical protein